MLTADDDDVILLLAAGSSHGHQLRRFFSLQLRGYRLKMVLAARACWRPRSRGPQRTRPGRTPDGTVPLASSGERRATSRKTQLCDKTAKQQEDFHTAPGRGSAVRVKRAPGQLPRGPARREGGSARGGAE